MNIKHPRIEQRLFSPSAAVARRLPRMPRRLRGHRFPESRLAQHGRVQRVDVAAGAGSAWLWWAAIALIVSTWGWLAYTEGWERAFF